MIADEAQLARWRAALDTELDILQYAAGQGVGKRIPHHLGDCWRTTSQRAYALANMIDRAEERERNYTTPSVSPIRRAPNFNQVSAIVRDFRVEG